MTLRRHFCECCLANRTVYEQHHHFCRNHNAVNILVTRSDRHDQPSQGDWSLVHTAAVVAEGTEGFTMSSCKVTRVDGQGLLLKGYHRDARILRNDFEWIGSHAMVSWGRTSACLDVNCIFSVLTLNTCTH